MNEFSKKLDEKKAEKEMQSAAMDTLLGMLVESAPEEMAIDFKILKCHKEVNRVAAELVEEVTLSGSDEYSTEAKKEVLEYLTMVADGIKNYTEIIKEELKNKTE